MTQAALPNLNMEYEISGNGTPLLMIMGVGGQLVQWPPDFVEALIAAGFMTIRPDNRDVGLSQKFEHLGVPNTQRALFRQALGLTSDAPYTLEDMAEDHIQLLDHLGIESCHVIGISMGSMIAQILAAKYPSRIQSVTLMLTNTGKLRHALQTKPRALQILLKRSSITDAEHYAEYFQQLFSTVGSPTLQRPPERLREAGHALYERGYHPNGFKRQVAAIVATGDRERFYSTITQPTAIIQGKSDPLMSEAAGRAVEAAIPTAKGHYFIELGHDLPAELVPQFVQIIRDLVNSTPELRPI
jgi:pimeloyl-ACP methyl ester carboxylesterase